MMNRDKVRQVAEAYTAAWNSGSAEAVAEFYAMDGRIVINRGEPWEGRTRVAAMAAGFFADVPDLKLGRILINASARLGKVIQGSEGSLADVTLRPDGVFEWKTIQPLLPNKPRGVPRVDDRRVLNGIF